MASFRRSKTPATCLVVGNAGEAAGLPAATLHQLLQPAGAIAAHPHRNSTTPVVFVEFDTAEHASRAKHNIEAGSLLKDVLSSTATISYATRCCAQRTTANVGYEALCIPGLSLLLEYVSPAEEAALLACVDAQPWERAAARRVQHYGRRFSYVERGVASQPAPPLPADIAAVAHRASTERLLQGHSVDQVTVNEYTPGVGFTAHVDTHSAFQGAVLSLSLAGHTVLELRRPGSEARALLLPQRSLLVMADEARLGWFHYIPHRKHDRVGEATLPRPARRVSLTMRSVRSVDTPCRCAFAAQCDSQGGGMPPTRLATLLMQHQQADAQLHEQQQHTTLESTHVHTVYDAIAGHFSSTRFAVWGSVRSFITSLDKHALVADVGCGNGKYLYVRPDLVFLASDRSPALAAVATRRLASARQGTSPLAQPSVADVAVADALHLPYATGCADAALCIAVLHHVSTAARRRRLLSELRRVLRLGGRALVTVWALEQEDGSLLAKWTPLEATGDGEAGEALAHGGIVRDYLVPWHVPMHRADAPAALATGEGDAVVDSRKHAVVLQRYYHLFAKGELEALVEGVGGLRVLRSYYERSNWGVELESVCIDTTVND